MEIKPTLERIRAGLVRFVRDLAALTLRVARAIARALAAAWRSPLRRRLTRPALVASRIVLLGAVLGAGTVAFLRASVQTIPPTDIAVFQNNWGSDGGVVPKDVGAGKVVAFPGRETVHRLSARTHYLRFGMESEGNDLPSLELLSSDGLEMRISVTVPYRIADGEAHMLVAEGRRSTYATAARAAAERVLLQVFADVDRDGWASVDARRAAEALALQDIGEAFDPFHLTPLGVHVTAAWFPPTYEVELNEQKLLEQRILTDEMLGRLDETKHELLVAREAQARAEVELSSQYDFQIEQARIGLEAEVLDVQREASRYRFQRETAADNAYEKAVAEGKLALDTAEALRERLVNEALETDGGRLLLARDAAKSLRFKSVSLDANNPDVPSILDLDALSRLLIGE